MKKIILLFLSLTAAFNSATSQTTAQNWTKTDCLGNNYTLYDYLDSNQVTIMEFSMGCSGCTSAYTYFENLKHQYNTTYPGKVKLFFMDYWNGHTCSTDVLPTVSAPGSTSPGFIHCITEKNYYTSVSPMPMIVIAAGCNHTVYYKRTYFTLADTVDVRDSIMYALNSLCTSSISNTASSNATIKLFPNPATDKLFIDFNNVSDENYLCVITDVMGNQLKKIILNPTNSSAGIDIKGIPPGSYFLKLSSSKHDLVKRFCVVE